jgi:hypothetical protein
VPSPPHRLLQKKKNAEAATLQKELSKADKLALKDMQAKLKLQKEAERLSEKAKKEEVCASMPVSHNWPRPVWCGAAGRARAARHAARRC